MMIFVAFAAEMMRLTPLSLMTEFSLASENYGLGVLV